MYKDYKAPPFLAKGDKIGICSMASAVSENAVHKAVEMLKQCGFEVVCDENIFAKNFTFAGKDEVRKLAIQKMLDDPEIKAIFSSRGGYGVSRIIDQLDFSQFIQKPKWVVGFSDITALHCKIQSLGFQSIHGPMPSTFSYDQASFDFLIKTLLGKGDQINATTNISNRIGGATAPIVGGNLCLLAHNVGSSGDISFDGHILYLEDIGEYAYNIDRMMLQLKRANKLANLAALVIGDFSDIKENSSPFGMSIEEIVLSHTKDTTYPIAFNFPIGHESVNFALRNGAEMTLSVTEKNSKLYYNELV